MNHSKKQPLGNRYLKSPLTILISVLASILLGCGSKTYTETPSEFLSHWSQGDLYQIVNRECKPYSEKIVSDVVDSIKHSSVSLDHSIRLSDSDGVQYTLGLGLPENPKTEHSYPLVIYLHGGVGTDVSTKGEYAYEMLDGLRDSLDIILASPSANRFAPWWGARGLNRILQTIRYVSIHYPVDENKIFLAGVSDGATGCYAAANSINGPFAGFFAISGYGGMLPNLGVQLSVENLKRRPIYNVQGGRDRLYPSLLVNKFLSYLQSQGVAITVKEYPDEEHGFNYREKEFPKLTELIRSWSRPRKPDFKWEIIPGVPNVPDQIIRYESADQKTRSSFKATFENDTIRISSRNLTSVSFLAPPKRTLMAYDSRTNPFTVSELPPEKSAGLFFSLGPTGNKSLYTIHFRR